MRDEFSAGLGAPAPGRPNGFQVGIFSARIVESRNEERIFGEFTILLLPLLLFFLH